MAQSLPPRSTRDQGFTLIEILVVIIIIGILAAIAIPVYLNQRKKAVDTSLRAELKSLAAAQETWLTDNPQAIGTTNLAVLEANGYRHTTGNIIWVYLDPTVKGYALMARSNRDSNNGACCKSVIYDSVNGGIMFGGKLVEWQDYRDDPALALPVDPADWAQLYYDG